jgi:DNA-binding NarL/FixJ family response regulator
LVAPEAERWIVRAIAKVFAGEIWIPRSVAGEVIEALRRAAPPPTGSMALKPRRTPPRS